MVLVVWGTSVALALAAAVLALCARVSGAEPTRLLADLRSGLRRDDAATGPGLREEMRQIGDVDTEDGTVDRIFDAGTPDPRGYVDADEIAQQLRSAGRGLRGMAHLVQR